MAKYEDAVDIIRDVYTFQIGKKRFTVSLHLYKGLVVSSSRSILAEVLESQIFYATQPVQLGIKITGWCLVRNANESVEELGSLSAAERELLSEELDLPICETERDLWDDSPGSRKSFCTSRCAKKLSEWKFEHPIISSRYIEISEPVKQVFELIERSQFS